jgi:hypothetical protein
VAFTAGSDPTQKKSKISQVRINNMTPQIPEVVPARIGWCVFAGNTMPPRDHPDDDEEQDDEDEPPVVREPDEN